MQKDACLRSLVRGHIFVEQLLVGKLYSELNKSIWAATESFNGASTVAVKGLNKDFVIDH